MKIQPRVSGRAEFLNTYYRIMREGLVLTRTDPHRLYNLRCSQLPYCPRSVILDYLERGKYRPLDLMMAYYTSVGTAVHTVMQTYLSQSGQFLADYSCKHCKIDYPLSHVHECTECGRHTHYEEVTIDVGTKNGRLGIQGHIDGIFKDSKGNYWIVDFKTTSVAGAPAKERTPGDGYTRQVKAYAVLLRKQYKITQAQAAQLFGGGPVAFSKYENDDVAQSEAMDTLLRLVRRSPEAFWALVEEKGLQADFTQQRKPVLLGASGRVKSGSLTLVQGATTQPDSHYNPREFRQFSRGEVSCQK